MKKARRVKAKKKMRGYKRKKKAQNKIWKNNFMVEHSEFFKPIRTDEPFTI